MAEVYASSAAKRRKMCAGGVDASDCLADASCNSKAAASRLKDHSSTTPSKLKKGSMSSGPQTPSFKQQQYSTEDGLLSLSPQMLAPNLMLLNQILGALYVTLPMVRGRGKPTTYHNMRTPVQNFCGREFQVKHVQQIKAMCPEAINWEHILAFNPSTKRQEQQLCISMPTDPANAKQAADTTRMQQLFFQRLQQHQACAGAKTSELEPPLAELPPPAGPSTRDCTPSRQRVSSLLPATPQTAPPAGSTAQQMMSPPPKRLATAVRAPPANALMSPLPARTRGNRRLMMAGTADAAGQEAFTFSPAARQPDVLLSPRGGAGPFTGRNLSTPVRPADPQEAPGAQDGSLTPNLRPNRLFDTPVAATPQQSSAARPNTHATPDADVEGARAAGRQAAAAAGVKVRKLTFEAAPSSAAAGPNNKAHKSAAPSKESKDSSDSRVEVPKERGGIKFELGESTMALLRQVSSAEVKQEAAAKQQQLGQERALDMLPGTFEVLRAVYGDRGPCVKPKAEVVQLLRQKSTSKNGMSQADAGEQLELMLRLVPEFLRVVTSSGASLAGITQSVRINRQISWPAARQKLLAGAAEARSSGRAAAAHAVAAEQQREADMAAVAAAAAIELDDGEVSGSELEDEEDYEEQEELLVCDAGPEPAAAAAAAGVDELGLDILAELDGNAGTGSSSSTAAGGLDDEALMLLGGGCSKAGAKPAVSGAVLSALAFKAPARKAARK